MRNLSLLKQNIKIAEGCDSCYLKRKYSISSHWTVTRSGFPSEPDNNVTLGPKLSATFTNENHLFLTEKY